MPILKLLSTEELSVIFFLLAEMQNYTTNDIVYSEKETANNVYLIAKGCFKVIFYILL